MKVPFGQEWKNPNSVFDFPKLKLEKDEKARIVIIDEQPECEYVHTLRKVITDERGKPLMEEKKRKDDSTYEVPQTEFKGQYICLGEMETLLNKNIDPDNCPACKAATENSGAVARPEPRFVLNVLKYNLKKGTTTVNTPFQVTLHAWVFTLNRFNTLKDIANEHGSLQNVDLLLGPVEGPLMYQKFPVALGSKCEAWSSESRKETAFAVIQNDREEDLTPLLGRRVTFGELQTVVYEIVSAYNEAFGIPGNLPATPSKPAKEEPSIDVSALLNSSGAVEESSEDEDVSSEEGDDGSEPEAEDLNKLLASLGQ